MSRIEGKTQAVKEWASTWPEIDGYIKLNAILGDRDEASMNTIYSDHGRMATMTPTKRRTG